MKRLIEFIKYLFVCILGVLCFLTLFALAYLQESYRLCPPTDAERVQNPVLIEFLVGNPE